jgi:hypothetical protein
MRLRIGMSPADIASAYEGFGIAALEAEIKVSSAVQPTLVVEVTDVFAYGGADQYLSGFCLRSENAPKRQRFWGNACGLKPVRSS